ncbi:unnamed protein product [Arctogadus glacialis]
MGLLVDQFEKPLQQQPQPPKWSIRGFGLHPQKQSYSHGPVRPGFDDLSPRLRGLRTKGLAEENALGRATRPQVLPSIRAGGEGKE